jgi:hypothetical protein
VFREKVTREGHICHLIIAATLQQVAWTQRNSARVTFFSLSLQTWTQVFLRCKEEDGGGGGRRRARAMAACWCWAGWAWAREASSGEWFICSVGLSPVRWLLILVSVHGLGGEWG